MLFMGLMTWKPENRDKIRKAFAEPEAHPGKEIGVWSDIGDCRGFLLVEEDDAKAMAKVTNLWSDVATLEMIPVIESKELMKAVSKKK